MLDAVSLKEMMKDLSRRGHAPMGCVGIMFARPSSKVVQERILCDIEYFHHRSGKYINFYFSGYGAYWNEEKYVDKKDICTVDNVTWSFSSKMFSNFVNELERISKWEYGGGTELLILEYVSDMLDFSRAMLVPIDEIIEEAGREKLSRIIESIFRGYRYDTNIEVVKRIFQEMGLNKYAVIRELHLDYYSSTLNDAE